MVCGDMEGKLQLIYMCAHISVYLYEVKGSWQSFPLNGNDTHESQSLRHSMSGILKKLEIYLEDVIDERNSDVLRILMVKPVENLVWPSNQWER